MICNAINEEVKTGSLSEFKLSLREQYLTVIPRARVGYEMIDSQRGT